MCKTFVLPLVILFVCACVIVQSRNCTLCNCTREKSEIVCDCKGVTNNVQSVSMWGKCITFTPKNEYSKEVNSMNFSSDSIGELSSTEKEDKFLSLEKIVLTKCGINRVEESAFRIAENLKILHLESNNITKLPANVFKPTRKIVEIYLQGNKIQELLKEVFTSLESLRILNLSNNQLKYLEKDMFGANKNLEEINVENNNLKKFDVQVLGGLQNLRKLYLLENSLQCDCKLRNVYNKIRNLHKTSTIDCIEPTQNKRKAKNELEDTDFVCTAKLLQNVTEKENTLSCKVYGDPKPEIIWLYNNKTLNASSQVMDYNFTSSNISEDTFWYNFTVKNVSLNTQGTYECGICSKGHIIDKSSPLNLIYKHSYKAVDSNPETEGSTTKTPVIVTTVMILIIVLIIAAFVIYKKYFRMHNYFVRQESVPECMIMSKDEYDAIIRRISMPFYELPDSKDDDDDDDL